MLHHQLQCEWEFRASDYQAAYTAQIGAAGHISKSPNLLQLLQCTGGTTLYRNEKCHWGGARTQSVFRLVPMSDSLEKASKAHQSRAASISRACAGRVRGRAEVETGKPRVWAPSLSAADESMVRNFAKDSVLLQALHQDSKATTQQATVLNKQVNFLAHQLGAAPAIVCVLRIDLCWIAGSFKVGQVEDVVTITTAATYSEELATCFEDAENEQALDQLSNICCKTLKTIKPLTSSQPGKEGQYWLALSRLSATLGTTLKALPDGDDLLQQICDPLKPANGFEKSRQFVNGAHQASRIQFWEMVTAHIESIEEALQACSVST